MKFHCRWDAKPRDPKQETGNDCDVIQEFKFRGKQISPTFSYKQCELANLLAHEKEMTEKSVFRAALSPEMTSQSFPVFCFGLAVLYPRGSETSRFWYIKIQERKSLSFFFFAILISTFWRFYPANKKNLSYTLK